MNAVTKQKAEDITADLENWMACLPKQLRSLSLIHLAVPGSNDSMSWSINRTSEMAPDAEPALKYLKFLGCLWTSNTYKWSITQTCDVLSQLNAGIRYFNLRVATKVGTPDIYFVHGLYANEVRGFLGDVKNFLRMHSQEVVILDCQNFYAFEFPDHERFISLLTTTFSNKLLPWVEDMSNLTLDYMTIKCSYQIILIYRSDAARFGQTLLWPSAWWPSPQPDAVSATKLLSFLDHTLKCRDPRTGLVSRCVLTPTPCFIITHWCSNLKSKCATAFEKNKLRWIKAQKPGSEGGINIIISDFIEMSEFEFSKAVIGLNAKLLK